MYKILTACAVIECTALVLETIALIFCCWRVFAATEAFTAASDDSSSDDSASIRTVESQRSCAARKPRLLSFDTVFIRLFVGGPVRIDRLTETVSMRRLLPRMPRDIRVHREWL